MKKRKLFFTDTAIADVVEQADWTVSIWTDSSKAMGKSCEICSYLRSTASRRWQFLHVQVG